MLVGSAADPELLIRTGILGRGAAVLKVSHGSGIEKIWDCCVVIRNIGPDLDYSERAGSAALLVGCTQQNS